MVDTKKNNKNYLTSILYMYVNKKKPTTALYRTKQWEQKTQQKWLQQITIHFLRTSFDGYHLTVMIKMTVRDNFERRLSKDYFSQIW